MQRVIAYPSYTLSSMNTGIEGHDDTVSAHFCPQGHFQGQGVRSRSHRSMTKVKILTMICYRRIHRAHSQLVLPNSGQRCLLGFSCKHKPALGHHNRSLRSAILACTRQCECTQLYMMYACSKLPWQLVLIVCYLFNRPKWLMTAVALQEALPGHFFQVPQRTFIKDIQKVHKIV